LDEAQVKPKVGKQNRKIPHTASTFNQLESLFYVLPYSTFYDLESVKVSEQRLPTWDLVDSKDET